MQPVSCAGPGLVARLRQLVAEASEAEIVVSPSWAMTRAQLLAAVDLAAGQLHAAGLSAESRVGLLLSDERDHLIASLALFDLGATQVTLASFDTAEVHREIAQRVQLNALIAPDGTAPDLDRPTPMVSWPLAGPGKAYSRGGAEGSLVLRTSGTTGRPNLMLVGSEAIAVQAEGQIKAGRRRNFRMASIEHNNGKRHRLYGVALGEVGVFGPLSGQKLADFLAATGANHVQMSVMHASELARHEAPLSLRQISFELVGSPAAASLRRDFAEHVSSQMYIRYGATECGTIAILPPGTAAPGDSVGWPVSGVELEIVNEDGLVLPPETIGQVRVRARGMVHAYLDSPEQTRKRFRDGWFWPGDIGLLTADGQLCLKGRADDMMILNSINIFPAEIEDVLLTFPGVLEVGVSALRSPVHGDIPVAAVVAADGVSLNVPELMQYARNRLSLRAPRRIIQVQQLPRSDQGKVLRRQISVLFERRGTP